MSTADPGNLGHLPPWPDRRVVGIGIVGAGFIVRDRHLVAGAEVGVDGLTLRTRSTAEGGRRFDSVGATLDAKAEVTWERGW